MKKYLLFLLFLSSISLRAQTTTVSATITDSDGQPWAGGKWSVQFVPNPNFPNLNQYSINGVPLDQSKLQFQGNLDGSGSFTQTGMYDNTIVQPSGSTWAFVITPNASVQSSTLTPIGISGTTTNLSTFINNNIKAPRFSASGANSYGYLDIEISPTPVSGGFYYNVSSSKNRQWTGTAWQDMGGGGGGSGTVSGQTANFLPLASAPNALTSPSHVGENGSQTIVTQPFSVNNQLYQNRQDIIDVIADAGAAGAGNTSACVFGNYSGCHDDFTVLNSLLSSTNSSKHKIFFKPTTTIVNGCDYYSSQALTTVPNIEILGIVGNHFGVNTTNGTQVTLCFATGQAGLKLGQNSHINGLSLFGGDPWTSTNLATYIIPLRYGGTGANNDGLVIGAESIAENMNIYGFGGDCIRFDSAQEGSADASTVRDVFAELCRGSGIVHTSVDGQVGVVINSLSRSNQIYGFNDSSNYGNVYISGNTSGNHDAAVATNLWTSMNGTISGSVCSVGSCIITMTSNNSMFTHTYINKYDLSMNDRVEFTGTGDTNTNGVIFNLVSSTANTVTFNCKLCASTGAGGTATYDPAMRIWASNGTDGLRGGGWGVGQPNQLASAGGTASTFIGPYSEETDQWNEFTSGIGATAAVIQPMGLIQGQQGQEGGVVLQSQNLTAELPEIALIFDAQNPYLKTRFGGYQESFLTPTVLTAQNGDSNSATIYSTNVIRRSVYGNVNGWWMYGNGGAYNATTLTKAAMGACDSLTTTGRSTIDGTGCAWIPNLLIGNGKASGNPDISLDTCSAAPSTGTWLDGDICLNYNYTGAPGQSWAFECAAATCSGSTGWKGLVFTNGTLGGLADVNVTDGIGIDGYQLVYNNSTSKWIAVPTTSGGTVTHTLSALTSGSVLIGNGGNDSQIISGIDYGVTLANYFTVPYVNIGGTQSTSATAGVRFGTNIGILGVASGFNFYLSSTNPQFTIVNGGLSGTRMFSGNYYGWSSSATNTTAADTVLLRGGPAIVQSGTSPSAANALGTFKALGFLGGTTSTIAPGGATVVGTGGTATCTTGSVCDSLSGTITLTTGTGASIAGIIATATFGTARVNNPNCTINVEGGAVALLPTHSASTTILSFSTGVALVATSGTVYTLSYICGGN